MKSIDFTEQKGADLKKYIESDDSAYMYKIIVKSKPYNERGAYWPLENTYMNLSKDLYDALTKENMALKKHMYCSSIISKIKEKRTHLACQNQYQKIS